MALVTKKKLLTKAMEEHNAVGAFNVGNMKMVKGTYENVHHHISVFSMYK